MFAREKMATRSLTRREKRILQVREREKERSRMICTKLEKKVEKKKEEECRKQAESERKAIFEKMEALNEWRAQAKRDFGCGHKEALGKVKKESKAKLVTKDVFDDPPPLPDPFYEKKIEKSRRMKVFKSAARREREISVECRAERELQKERDNEILIKKWNAMQKRMHRKMNSGLAFVSCQRTCEIDAYHNAQLISDNKHLQEMRKREKELKNQKNASNRGRIALLRRKTDLEFAHVLSALGEIERHDRFRRADLSSQIYRNETKDEFQLVLADKEDSKGPEDLESSESTASGISQDESTFTSSFNTLSGSQEQIGIHGVPHHTLEKTRTNCWFNQMDSEDPQPFPAPIPQQSSHLNSQPQLGLPAQNQNKCVMHTMQPDYHLDLLQAHSRLNGDSEYMKSKQSDPTRVFHPSEQLTNLANPSNAFIRSDSSRILEMGMENREPNVQKSTQSIEVPPYLIPTDWAIDANCQETSDCVWPLRCSFDEVYQSKTQE